MKKYLVLLLLIPLLGCAGTWGQKSVTGYEVGATTLAFIQQSAVELRAQGALSEEKYAQLGTIYKKVRACYLTAGDVLASAITTDDTIKRDALMVEYKKLIAEYAALAAELVELAYNLGVLK